MSSNNIHIVRDQCQYYRRVMEIKSLFLLPRLVGASMGR